MADLTGDRSRAQMVLLIGFALAAVFVALAFLLNSAIYTENLATRGEDSRTSHAIAVATDVRIGMVEVVVYANDHNTSSYAALDGELADSADSVQQLTNRQQLENGGVVNVTYRSYTRGTWVNQSYETRNFTDANQSPDWDLVTGANGVRSARIHVTDPSYLEDTSNSSGGATMDNFTLIASDGTDQWRMELYHDQADLLGLTGSSPYVAEIEDGNGNVRYCSTTNADFWVNVSAGTFAGEECPLRFAENLSTVESVAFRNGDNAYGTYRLLANNETSMPTTPYNTTGSPPVPPTTTPAVYNATVRVGYQTRTLTYETNVTVDPGESDD